MKYYIITGTSRGIGEAIARELLVQGNSLICVSRSMNESLVETASGMGIPIYYFEIDLSKTNNAAAFMKNAFRLINTETAESIALINNAGILDPIGPAGTLRPKMMEQHIRTNLMAPAVLINAFIKLAGKMAIPKVILSISSGASEYPYYGWSMYCTSKAGIDMLTRTVALEQESVKYAVKLFALKPGIVETSMQELIRSTKASKFREKEKFVKLHNDGMLSSPKSVAEIITASLFLPDIPQGGIMTINQLKELINKAEK
jgi:benzil reductase ((S)-benzoin forming)